MFVCFLSIGSNIGNSKAIVKKCIFEISKSENLELIKASKLYLTKPQIDSNLPDIDQNHFVNACCGIKTPLNPEKLLFKLEKIEKRLGKLSKPKNFPRVIDIDIIFYGNKIISKNNLQIPHPLWQKRLFVLIPLSEILEEIEIENSKINILDFIKNNFSFSLINNRFIINKL
jgi:2-amino-4-hydroxy-6-hydroxymethyldihydropteridine diphosphokinase